MKSFDSRTYSINDFREWYESKRLVLAPKFQRRRVWSETAKSFLIDSIIRGKPIPKVFFRQRTDPVKRSAVREIVDGQQRLAAILDFLDDGFRIAKTHHKEFGKKVFSELPVSTQKEFLDYEISADLLIDASDSEVLDIFARLNSYSVSLNMQEKLNAEYIGEFKQASYGLSNEFYTFWTLHKIFTDQQVLRMADAQLASELLVAIVDGIHSRKQLLSFYKKYDTTLPKRGEYESRFRSVMDWIGEHYGEKLNTSNFRRPHMFYTLFTTIYHIRWGLPNVECKRPPGTVLKGAPMRSALDRVDALWDREDELVGEDRKFLDAARRGTTDASAREFRLSYVCAEIIRNT